MLRAALLFWIKLWPPFLKTKRLLKPAFFGTIGRRIMENASLPIWFFCPKQLSGVVEPSLTLRVPEINPEFFCARFFLNLLGIRHGRRPSAGCQSISRILAGIFALNLFMRRF